MTECNIQIFRPIQQRLEVCNSPKKQGPKTVESVQVSSPVSFQMDMIGYDIPQGMEQTKETIKVNNKLT